MALADALREEKIYPLLVLIRDTLKAEIPGLESCEIGVEENIVAERYPLVRIAISELPEPDENNTLESVSLLIYYGCKLYPVESGGKLDGVYRDLLNIDKRVKSVMRFRVRNEARQKGWPALTIRYRGSIWDEDRPVLPHHKLFAGRFLINC